MGFTFQISFTTDAGLGGIIILFLLELSGYLDGRGCGSLARLGLTPEFRGLKRIQRHPFFDEFRDVGTGNSPGPSDLRLSRHFGSVVNRVNPKMSTPCINMRDWTPSRT